jgi:hypothetical protein
MEHLITIIERVPEKRLQAAEILWKLGPDAEGCVALIRHVPEFSEKAALRLIELKAKNPAYYDCIFDHIADPEIRLAAGEYVLSDQDWFPGNNYAKVAEEVPELRERASEALRKTGAYDVDDINVFWKYGTEEDKSKQWGNLLQSMKKETSYGRILGYITGGELEIKDLAWPHFLPYFKDREKDLLSFLDDQYIQEKIFEIAKDSDWLDGYYEIIIKVERLREEAWQKMMAHKERETGLFWIIRNDKIPNELRDRAAEELFKNPLKKHDLHMLLFEECRGKAADLLMSGNYIDEN